MTHLQPRHHYWNRIYGFTLIELVLVLVILATLATLALNSVESQVDQTRFEGTSNTLRRIEQAIIGDEFSRHPDGTVRVSGFVADVGRPPLNLHELYMTPEQYAAYLDQVAPATAPHAEIVQSYGGGGSPAGDSNILVNELYFGWNGPYLRLLPGASSLTDGFGNGFALYDKFGAFISSPENAPAVSGYPAIITSLSKNASLDTSTLTDPYDKDVSIILEADETHPTLDETNRWQRRGPIQVEVDMKSGGGLLTANGTKVIVRIYGPGVTNSSTGAIGFETLDQEFVDVVNEERATLNLNASDQLYFGPRLIKAYQLDSEPTDEQDLEDETQSASKAFTVVPGTMSTIKLSIDIEP